MPSWSTPCISGRVADRAASSRCLESGTSWGLRRKSSRQDSRGGSSVARTTSPAAAVASRHEPDSQPPTSRPTIAGGTRLLRMLSMIFHAESQDNGFLTAAMP